MYEFDSKLFLMAAGKVVADASTLGLPVGVRPSIFLMGGAIYRLQSEISTNECWYYNSQASPTQAVIIND